MFSLNIPRFHKWHLPDTDQSLVPSGVLYPPFLGDEQEQGYVSRRRKTIFDHNIIYKRTTYVVHRLYVLIQIVLVSPFFKLVAFSPL